jgi:2,3-bisphosphoglycerate-independent phosphoglycerate mutase
VPQENPAEAISQAYAKGQTDEFIEPVTLTKQGKAVATVQDGDAILFFNFRADRARQMTHAFTDKEFKGFTPRKRPKLTDFATCTRYEKSFTLPVLFPPQQLHRILGEEISRNGLKQLRIAETEKYAHVTYFFNGGREEVFENESRVLIDSPREVATYDLKPEMSAYKVTEALLEKLNNESFDLIVLNYANSDMVGHSGILPAAIKACETVDECLGRLVPFFLERGGKVIITADHGNADIMFDESTNGPYTAHTLNPVPFILLSAEHKSAVLHNGGALKDIAPTILNLMGLKVPAEMEGINLIQ